jgi:hypothetical protein
MSKKSISVAKKGTPSPSSTKLSKKAGDTVEWTVTPAITSPEFLVIRSNVPSILPLTNGTAGKSTISVPLTYPAADINIDYVVSVNTGSGETPAGGGTLVIDTIGTGGGSGACEEDEEKSEPCEVVHGHHGSKS